MQDDDNKKKDKQEQNNPIMPWGSDTDEGFEGNSFIESFLNDYGPQKTNDNGPELPGAALDIFNFDMEDYESPSLPAKTNNKLVKLKKLIVQFEEKSPANFHRFQQAFKGNYKVNYKNSLNPAQLYAAVQTQKPLLVIAGAGSGKTRTIIYRLSFLLENGVQASEILLLTFTRKAAKEMVDRAKKLLGNTTAQGITAGTFHAFANTVLRKYANLLGIDPKFTIIDTIDSQDIISLIRDELIRGSKKGFPQKDRIFEIISKSRNKEISLQDLIEDEFSGLKEYTKYIEVIYQAYEKYKELNNLFDFDDLMVFLRDFLQTNKIFRNKIQETYKYILVDEYQDTNIHQKQIVDSIAEKYQNIMVVGDDSQSIYAFRGANFENILMFPLAFPKGEVVKIEQNYRSNQSVLNFCNAIIENALLGYNKKLFTNNTNNFAPIVLKFYDQEDEAKFIVDKIIETRENGIALKDIAVLYRATYHGNFIQNELTLRGIPYVVVGGIKFMERRHVRDIIAFLRIVHNPYDPTAWHRVLKLIYGIGDMNAKKIIQTINQNKGLINFNAFRKRAFYPELKKLQEILHQIANPTMGIPSKINLVKEFYTPILQRIEEDYDTRLLDIDVLIKLSEKYIKLDAFLSDFALDPPSNRFQDKTKPLVNEEEEEALTLSTVHSAKGLEWFAVCIPPTLDGLFPSVKAMKNFEELEEERRLFYVACTRAKEQLYITMPSYFSAWEEVFTMPSRFIIETGKELFAIEQ